MRNKIIVDLSLVIIISILFIDLIFAQVIPENRRVDWSNVGLEINRPEYYDHIIDVCQQPYNVVPNPNGDWNINVIGLRRAIDSARVKTGWKLLFFSQPGTYRFGGIIDLGVEDSNLVFKGIGSNNVILFFKASDEVLDMFRISGTIIETLNVTNEIFKNNNEITLQSGSLDIINHYIDFFDDRPTNYDWARVGQIFKVNSYLGNSRYKLSDNFSINHPLEYGPQIIKFLPAKNIGFEDITIQREGGISRGSNASCNIRFKYATNCWVYGVESWGTMGWHFGIEKSSHIWIHGNFLHHANNYAGGDAYGVAVHDRSTNCLIENNIFNYLRHSMLVQSSSTKNVFAYNYSYDKYCNADCNFLGDGSADISLHGTFTNSNLFEGNMAEFLKADRSHGFNGDFNTFFRNQIGTIGFLNDIEIEFIYSPNIIGNKCTELNHDLNVFSKLDFYGISNGINYTHNYYGDNRGNLDPTIYLPDYSYYLQNNPLWLTGYTWPPIGPRISTNDQYPTNIIPSLIRHLAGGKKTLDGPMVKTIVKLNPGYYPETNSYGGSYKINGNNTTTWYPLFNEQVTIQAFPQNSGESFAQWSDGNMENPRTFNAKSKLEVNAIFKKIGLSNTSSTYDNTSQRKFVRSSNGYLHRVYESIGNIWYERSTNNGVSWQIMNNGKPLNSFEAKQPAIDFYHNNQSIAIVFQEKSNSSTKIKLAVFFDGFTNPQIEEIDAVNASFETINATPAIAWSGNNNIVVTYKNISNLTSILVKPDLYVFNIFDKINLASGNSFNPSMVATKYNSVTDTFYLAYQELDTKIYYVYFTREESPESLPGDEDWFLVDSFREEISVGSGYSKNYNPVISLRKVSGDPWVYITWIGWRNYVQEEEGLNKITVNPIGETRLLLRRKSRGGNSTFNVYGNAVNNQSSNKGTTLVSNAESFAIAWSEQSGNSFFNKLVKYSQSNTPITISTIGKSLQVNNSADFSNMFANTFQSSQVPYSFSLSPNFNSNNQNKINSLQVYNGREGIVTKDSVSFYFALGDIICNGNLINFIPIPDTLNIDSLDQVNTYLFSESFTVNDNSSLFYGVQYGITDSLSALLTLSGNKEIRFKVELLDELNGGIIGVFDDITYNAQNAIQYANIGYQVNLNGIGNRTIRLRLVVESNLESTYSLADRFADESVIAKKNFKQVGFSGNLTISDYNIEQNYPNPFNPVTTIRYQLPKESNVVIKIFDILGNEIYTLVNEEKPTGIYEVSFNASNLSSGVYFYRINAGDFNSTKKMILIK
jgi:hypothetical protein